MNRLRFVSAPSALVLIFCLSLSLQTENKAAEENRTMTARSDFLAHSIRVDGSNLPTSLAPIGPSPSTNQSSRRTAPTPCSVVDAWSNFLGSPNNLNEDYDFTIGDDVVLNLLIKVGSSGFPGLCADFLIFPCGTEAIPPVPTPIIFFDDVSFGPSGVSNTLLVASVTISDLENRFGPGSCIDWFAVVDFDQSDNPDTDGDMMPDCALENPPTFVDLGSADTDQVGAQVIDFFNPGSSLIIVYGPEPPSPASKAPGAKPGESGETRPWCFTLLSQ